MSATDATPFHVGLTPERVVDVAAELSRETHLMSWSIRDLAGRLGIAASGIYHHVGGEDLLCRAVVERMIERIKLPDPQLTWQEWFRTLLYATGPTAAEYPGTAKWMLMRGPTLPAVLPVLEVGMAMLQDAGIDAGQPSPTRRCSPSRWAMTDCSTRRTDPRSRHDDRRVRPCAPHAHAAED